ncbi:MAG: hypothetical protein A3F83_00530 [Candidatus Glassbacteria bacterium RIFCSPLOWO2_12_FULL_58_11]|uniref:Uncharacterized protein n=1 Tax=Candidatus Glassbacteria bacterium RIFCSPLOWO2_12_FULL_58_11 TaxID=1817867 RepID=A0A1F5YPJ0_9BACT|nr:MAG: hypothetical protein A3F83_00530 [Candidatus Glassbacteria bacterium RIFCSPLOWO2_12_FULL_58_11]
MEIKQYNRITLYGPHPLERDERGHLKNYMADFFPAFRSIIVGSGLHVALALDFIEESGRQRGHPLDEREQQEVYDDLVALILRGEHVVIRSIPDKMEKCFRTAELLEDLVPAELLRFTGVRDPQVRRAFKLRGESWKMAPRYFTVEEIIRQINLSVVSVGTRNRFYYKVESGGRLITPDQFAAIIESLDDLQEFRSRVCEVADLYARRNQNYVRELDFFGVAAETFDFSLFEKLAAYLQSCKDWTETRKKKARKLFEQALENFRRAVPPDLQRDAPNNPAWRTHFYSELNEIPPTEESILGISDEFNMNIRWLPGCRITGGKVVWDPHIEDAVASLLKDFFRFYGPLEYINLGRLMRSQSTKRAAGSYREVFIAVLKQRNNATEQIRILRKVWRNILYYLNRGYPLERARELAAGYLEYTFDRREILSLLGVNTPPVNYLTREEELPGIGVIPVAFFNRPYISGLATDKVSDYYYEHEGFVRAQAALLGYEAGLNLIIGRCDPDSGLVFFGDGDELLQFDKDKMIPSSLVLADYTGAFADVVSPLEKFLPEYSDYLAGMLSRIKVQGHGVAERLEVGKIFIAAMEQRIVETRRLLTEVGEVSRKIGEMAALRDPQVNPVGIKWERVVARLKDSNVPELIGQFGEALRKKLGYY